MKYNNTEWFSEYQRLINETDPVCISMVIPAQKLFSGYRVNDHSIHRLVAEVKNHLKEHMGNEVTSGLIDLFKQLATEINFKHGMEGVGLFVSKGIQRWMPLYFPVNEKIAIDSCFDTRELNYQNYYAVPYNVLLLSKDEVRLLAGVFNQLIEVKDTHFPLKFEDEYEYSHPSRGLTYEGYAVAKDFEREKSQLKKIRTERFFHEVDELLHEYLSPSDRLILTGTEQDLAYFENKTKLSNIIGRLPGNFFKSPIQELGESTWHIVTNYLNAIKQRWILELKEKTGTGEAVNGIIDCWKTAYEGNSACLILEKDFMYTGYLTNENPERLYLTQPKGSFKILQDAVSSLIELVLKKRGELVLVEKDALNDFQHIGLIKRY